MNPKGMDQFIHPSNRHEDMLCAMQGARGVGAPTVSSTDRTCQLSSRKCSAEDGVSCWVTWLCPGGCMTEGSLQGDAMN